MDRIVQLFTLLLQFGLVKLDCCYQYLPSYTCVYCSGYCYGYTYGYQYCDESNTSAGVIAGAVIGSLIGLGLLVAVVVFIVIACNKSGSQRGRVVQPNTGVSVISSSQANTYYGTQPSAPFVSYPQPAHNMTYPPPQNAAYPPPNQSYGMQPLMQNQNYGMQPPMQNQNYGMQPPNYSSLNQEAPPPPTYKQ